MRCALFTHPDCLLHEAEPGHPERPARLVAILNHLIETGLESELDYLTPNPAGIADFDTIHDSGFVRSLYAAIPNHGIAHLDADTSLGPMTVNAAELAAGAVRDAVELVLRGDSRRAFCAIRPPGHHAEEDQAMGFCFFNNVALGAESRIGATGNRTRRDPRLRRAPRQRHGRHLPRTSRGARLLELPAPALPASTVRPAATEHRQHAAAGVHRRRRIP